MAATISDPTIPSPNNTYQPSKSISDLRALAQAHLIEIEEQRSEEQSDRLARDLQLQLYSKPARRPSARRSDMLLEGWYVLFGEGIVGSGIVAAMLGSARCVILF